MVCASSWVRVPMELETSLVIALRVSARFWDTIIFSLGSYDFSVGLTLVIAAGAIFAALIVLLIVILGNNSRQADAAAQAEKNRLGPLLEEREGLLKKQEAELDRLRQTNTELEARAAALQAQMNEQQKHNNQMQEKMSGQFKLMAGDILKSHGETFSRQNRQQVDALLKPLSDKISEFQKQSHEGAAQLAEQMKTLTADSLRMSEEANNLTRALKGSSQTQGAWGEMILSNILEKSGLMEGEQFLTQQTHSGEAGARVRTDVEVLFPNGDRMVIDSKVSLSAYEAFCNCTDENEQAGHMRNHIASIKSHIKTLGAKNYQVHAGSGLDYVMMFVPIEAAFASAFSEDRSLIDYAIRQNVYITTPTTLMVALRTVRNVWDIEARNKNAEKIADMAGGLYDKIAGFLDSMDKVDKSLSGAQKSFDEAKNRLSAGRGSVVSRVRNLQKLGAKNTKQLPPGWDDEQDNMAPPADGQKTTQSSEFVPDFLPGPTSKDQTRS